MFNSRAENNKMIYCVRFYIPNNASNAKYAASLPFGYPPKRCDQNSKLNQLGHKGLGLLQMRADASFYVLEMLLIPDSDLGIGSASLHSG